jgi:hypothetical protein
MSLYESSHPPVEGSELIHLSNTIKVEYTEKSLFRDEVHRFGARKSLVARKREENEHLLQGSRNYFRPSDEAIETC